MLHLNKISFSIILIYLTCFHLKKKKKEKKKHNGNGLQFTFITYYFFYGCTNKIFGE